MKHSKITALLALTSLDLKKPLLGGEHFTELKESQLDKIEAALDAAENAADNTSLEQLMATLTAEKEALTAQVTALTAETEKLQKELNERPAHSLPGNDGKEASEGNGLIDGYLDPNDAHNKLLNEI